MVEQTIAGVRLDTDPDVYDPHDDSLMLVEAVRNAARGRILEVGTGSGLVAIAAAQAGHRVVATDVNLKALGLARANAKRNGVRLNLVRADLLTGVRAADFDLIAFNPPYLPTKGADRVPGPLNLAFDGGPSGRVVVERFLRQLPPQVPTLLVVSTLQGEAQLATILRRLGVQARVVAERVQGLETLRVLDLVKAAAARKI